MKIRKAEYEDEADLLAFVKLNDDNFNPPLRARVDLAQWVKKILNLGMVLVSGGPRHLNGAIAFYCNDRESKQAVITFLGVDRSVWRRGIGRRLLGEAINVCRRKRMQSALVTTEADNAAAITLYETFGFKMDDRETERTGKTALRLSLMSVRMRMDKDPLQ